MKSKPKKSKNNKNVVKKLQKVLRSTLNYEKEHNNVELLIKDETRFLEIIEAFPPETLIQSMLDLKEILKRLGYSDGIRFYDIKYYGNETIKAEINGWDLLKYRYKELSNSIGKELTAYSFFIFYIIASYRLLYYMYPNSRDALYVKLGSILQNDKYSSKFFLQALENLSKKAVKEYKEKSGTEPFPVDEKEREIPNESTPEQRISSYIHESVIEQFKKTNEENEKADMSIEESLIKATYNEIFSIPESARNKLIDEHRKYEKRKDDFILNKDKRPYVLLSDEIPDDKNQAEDIEKVSNINSLLDSISDPLENQIARLKVIDGLPIRAIAEKVNVSKSTVGRIIKRLNIPS